MIVIVGGGICGLSIGWRLAQAGRPDVILMDAAMTGMGGFDACKKIIEEDPDAKVIFLTPHSAAGWVKQALSTEVFSLLKKPIGVEDVRSLLNSVVESDATRTRDSSNETEPRTEKDKPLIRRGTPRRPR